MLGTGRPFTLEVDKLKTLTAFIDTLCSFSSGVESEKAISSNL